jgi:DNA-binding MarR family transcriptional regulator
LTIIVITTIFPVDARPTTPESTVITGAETTPRTAKYNVLRVLRDAGSAGLACGDVSERLVERDPDVTRLLDRLEARGWVTRARDVEDRRVVRVRITPDGLDLVARLDDAVAATHARQFAPLAGAELGTLMSLLERVRVRAAA